MKQWILVITCVSIFSCMIKILIPNGKSRNTIIFIFSVFLMFCIISPLSNKENLDSIFDFEYEYSEIIDDNVNFFHQYKADYYTACAKTCLKKVGIDNCAVDIMFNDKGNFNEIKKITVKYNSLDIKENIQHINIPLLIKNELSALFGIPEKLIEVLENGI